MSPLEPFSEHVWTVFHPLSIAGLQLGTRATVVRLPSGRIAIISPVPFDEETALQIDELGEVDAIIAPNKMHHLYFSESCRRWPEARALVPAGLEEKVDLPDRVVTMGDRGSFEDSLCWVAVDGAPKLGEHLFVEPRDEVLVVSDLAFHFTDHPQWIFRQFMRLNGVYGRLGPSRIARRTFDDHTALGLSLQKVLDLDWDAIIVAHGELIDKGGRHLFEEAFSGYLPS